MQNLFRTDWNGRIAAAILLSVLAFTGCETFKNKYKTDEGSRADMEREFASKSAADTALGEMEEELRKKADEGDIFEPDIQAKVSSIGIRQPTAENLAENEGYISGMVRTTLNNNFRKFAGGYITVTNVDEEDEAALQTEVSKSLASSDEEALSTEGRIAARALMTGKIIKIGEKRFNLDFSITDTETHEVLAGYNQNHSDIELTDGIAVNKMTESFLRDLGVRLNEAGKLALLGNSNEAETALAKGRAAAEAGRGLEAMNYLYNAENFDTTKQEAAGSLSEVQTQNRETLGVGAQIAEFFGRQALWQGRLDEFNEFYRSHPPFELYYTPPTPGNMRGSGESRAYDLSFKIGLRWSQNQIDVMERVLNEYILDELYNNSAEDIALWELKGLPEDSDLFTGPGNFNFNLIINVENERGEVIVSGPMVLSGSLYRYNGHIYADCTQEFSATFQSIKYIPEQITDQLYIRIASINDIDIKTVGENGFTRVVQTQGKELPQAQPSSLPQEFLASNQAAIDAEARREQAAAAAGAIQDAAAANEAERERKRQEARNNPLRKFRLGTAVTGGYTLGTEETAIVNWDLFLGSSFWNFDFGLMFYPGTQRDHLAADYTGPDDYTTGAMGIDVGLDLALVGRNWLLNAGGGATFFLAWASVDSGSDEGSSSGSGDDSGSSSENIGNDFFIVPYLKLSFDWRLFGVWFLRVGYRMDIYPAEKFFTYFKSETTKVVADQKFADNIFLGLSIIY
jgi:hypothetical protein